MGRIQTFCASDLLFVSLYIVRFSTLEIHSDCALKINNYFEKKFAFSTRLVWVWMFLYVFSFCPIFNILNKKKLFLNLKGIKHVVVEVLHDSYILINAKKFGLNCVKKNYLSSETVLHESDTRYTEYTWERHKSPTTFFSRISSEFFSSQPGRPHYCDRHFSWELKMISTLLNIQSQESSNILSILQYMLVFVLRPSPCCLRFFL